MRSLLFLLCHLLLPCALRAAEMPLAAAEALKTIEAAAAASNSDAVLIMRGDEVMLERYSDQGKQPIELMSVTKSVVALAIGCLIADGLLESLDTPVHRFFPEWKQGRKQAITVRMLMDHSSGLQNEMRPAEEIYPAKDVIQLALAAELSHDPGTNSSYNNKAVNLLAGIIARAAGEPMDAYVTRRLLTPLGIRPGEWFKDAAGNPHAMAGLPLTARDAAALGRLVADRGQANGKSLVPAEFIDQLQAPSKLSQELGLLWMRKVAWVRFHADDESFALLEKVGVKPELIAQLRPLNGRKFGDADALYGALAEHLGENWFETWHKELIAPHGIGPWRPFHSKKGPVEAFEANGSLGQYIVVIPKASLVAVRQIVSRDDHAEEHSYGQFTQHVQALADALVPTAAH